MNTPIVRFLIAFATVLSSFAARAEIYSPSSLEVHFTYSAQFLSDEKASAKRLALEHAKYLFGYFQNPEIVDSFHLNENIAGIASPRWEPTISDVTEANEGRDRLITYAAEGRMIINRSVVAKLFKDSPNAADWKITLPYRLDLFFDSNCNDPAYPDQDQYWYVYDPFRTGCAHLRRGKLAREVVLHLSPVDQLPETTEVPLAALRGDNGNGDTFEITSISGFYDDAAKRSDPGRPKFTIFNKWLKSQGFAERVVYHKRDRELDVFTKDATANDGHVVHIKVVRLLAPTEIDEDADRTFAQFVERAFYSSDVLVYDGHSGMGVNLRLDQIEKRAGAPVKFNPTKQQLFYFASCSSYAYYLGLFRAQKPAGTLSIMTNGLESDFTPPPGEMLAFFTALFDMKKDTLTWGELLKSMEVPLKGNTYMDNVSVE